MVSPWKLLLKRLDLSSFCFVDRTDIAKILQPLGKWMLLKILPPFVDCMSQLLRNHSYTGRRRKSATSHSLDFAEILQPLIH